MKSKPVFLQLVLKSWHLPLVGILSLCPVVPTLAQSTPPAPSTSNPATSETDYTLGAGDRLRVDVFQVEDFSGEYLVLVDGTVSLPLAGRLQAEGKTIPELSELISQKYAQYLKRPVVTVSLLTPRPLKMAIAGEVNNPGSYNITLNEEGQFPSVTDLIQQAGGITTAADVRQVQIRRSLNGREQVLNVNLWELLVQGNLAQNVTLRDGDTVIIPTNNNINAAETRQLADASFGIRSDQPVNVAVVGEVYRPGSYQIEPERLNQNNNNNNTTSSRAVPPRLSQAIAQAGGIKPLANIRQVEVRRLTRSGTEQTLNVNLWQLLRDGDTNEDVILQEGDTIVIPTAENLDPSEAESLASASFSPSTVRVNVVGEVKEPGVVEVPPNTPLNQAILAAGGFDDRRANKGEVQLIRLNPNGTVSKREIEIDLAADINEENNPTLRSSDVVVVGRSGLAQVSDTVGTVLAPIGSTFSIFRLFGIGF